MKYMDIVCWLAYALVIIGALNWGLYGSMRIDLVQQLFGTYPMVADTIYILVGISGLILLGKQIAK